MSSLQRFPTAASRFGTLALTAALYVVAGVAGFALNVLPGYAAPLYPAAGVALAAVLVAGSRMLPAVLVGAISVSLLRQGLQTPALALLPASLGFAAVLGFAATLQAAALAKLIRRFVSQPLVLSESPDVLRFIAAAAGGCLISSCIGNAAEWMTGQLPGSAMDFNLVAWWIGDLLGVLIVVPIALTLVGRPREAWAPRRRSVGITLAVVTLVLASGILALSRWQEERRIGTFERDAASATLLLASGLHESLNALKALHGALLASDQVTEAQITLATGDWLVPGHLLALGWAKWLRPTEVAAFEEQARASGMPGYHVFDLPGAAVDRAADVVPIRYLEPMQFENRGVIGLNQFASPVTREAIERSRRTGGLAAASAGFRPFYRPDGADRLAVVVFQVIFQSNEHATGRDDARTRTPTGVALAVLWPQDQLLAAQKSIPSYLRLCVVDTPVGEPPSRLAGPAGCESVGAGPVRSRSIDYAGRRLELRASALDHDLPGGHDAVVWLFALVCLVSTAMLSGFLLVTTGRTRRIETAVRERTAALVAEVQEREQAQTALRESEQRFRNILNNVPIGIWYTDLDGNVKQANPRFCGLIGYDEVEVLTLNARQFGHPDDRAQAVLLTDQLVTGEIPLYRRQERYLARNGAVVRVQATVTLLRDALGEPRRIVGVVEDVTEHIKLEDAERAREAAEASNQAKNEFLSRMSHELRTPLNAMLGFAQLLELDPRQPLSSTQRPWVAQIQQAGWHLLEMINDVLDLSRIESGNLRLQTETVNLDELIESTRAMVQGEADLRRITIVREPIGATQSALGDPTRVKQILINLLSNAVKYNTDGGRIVIVTRQVAEQAVEIGIDDTGLGMTALQLAQLFQPFNRLGQEKSGPQGTGIGLVISQRLAELMGGSLRASSVAGAGSSFVLTLPCENDPDTVRSDFDPLAAEPAAYHRRLVHYIEDNETNVEVMRGILAQRPQVELEVSITGLDGLAAVRARRPDLILLDMHLPDISGLELLRHFKADPALASIPVVVVSADALAQQVTAAYDAGCASYLTKPVNIAELLRLVDTLLDEIDTRYG